MLNCLLKALVSSDKDTVPSSACPSLPEAAAALLAAVAASPIASMVLPAASLAAAAASQAAVAACRRQLPVDQSVKQFAGFAGHCGRFGSGCTASL